MVRPHGIRGEVAVEVRTDDPGQRFAVGSVLGTDQRHVNAAIFYSIWHYFQTTEDVGFLRDYGAEMMLEIARFWASIAHFNTARERYEIHGVMGPDEFHDHQLVGLTVVTTAGEQVGVVTDVRHHGQDLLVIEPAAGSIRRSEVLVPFVAAIAVDVDVAGGRMVIDPPAGLLDLGS